MFGSLGIVGPIFPFKAVTLAGGETLQVKALAGHMEAIYGLIYDSMGLLSIVPVIPKDTNPV